MKNLIFYFWVITLIFIGAQKANAGWELYDDFNTGLNFDASKWSLDSSSAEITIESGAAKFVHLAQHPNDSSYLHFVDQPENIYGIKAKITIQTCSGDVRARTSSYVGKSGENHIWSGLQLQPGSQRIYGSSGLEGPPPSYTWIYSLYYAHFKNPIDLVGNSYNVTMLYDENGIEYKVEELGKITYKYSFDPDPVTSYFRGIGTKSTNGDGPCTVYFDDVYVFRK